MTTDEAVERFLARHPEQRGRVDTPPPVQEPAPAHEVSYGVGVIEQRMADIISTMRYHSPEDIAQTVMETLRLDEVLAGIEGAAEVCHPQSTGYMEMLDVEPYASHKVYDEGRPDTPAPVATACDETWDGRKCQLVDTGHHLHKCGNWIWESTPPVLTSPAPAAEGRNPHWVRLGEVGVDSAHMAITDPAFAPPKYGGISGLPDGPFGHVGEYGSGVQFMAGFGDGGYDVWALVVDYGEDGEVDERVAQVVVTLIDERELRGWRE